MEQKIALVVGGSGGIGRATVEQLHKNGFYVCATYHSSNNFPENVESIEPYRCDTTNADSVSQMMQSILAKHRKIDVVVYALSPEIINTKLTDLTWDTFMHHFDAQVKGLFGIVHNLTSLFQQKHPIRFIPVLTHYCFGKPPARLAHYISAKYALLGFSKSLAAELPQYGSTCNMVSPGMVNTDLLSNLPPKLVEMAAYSNPLKRIATPEDVANVITFLASDEARYLNGVHIPINGGELFP